LAKIGDKKITLSDFKGMLTYFDERTKNILEQQPNLQGEILKNNVQRMVVSKKSR